MSNEKETYDWYKDTMEIETEDFFHSDVKKTRSAKVFDFCIHFFRYIALFCGGFWMLWYVFSFNDFRFYGVSLKVMLGLLFLYFGSIGIIAIIIRYLTHLSSKFGENLQVKVECTHRWAIILIWYILKLYSFKYYKHELGDARDIYKSYLESGLLTSISFVVFSLSMQCFYESFVQKSLRSKLHDVEISERILGAMKDFQDLSSKHSSVISEENLLYDLLDYNMSKNEEADEEKSGSRSKKKNNALYLKEPELLSVNEAIKLAKDVFQKASEGADMLDLISFSIIFPNDQISLQAFPFFESTSKNEILRKDFRDTIIHFYVDRINLEKNFDIAKGFVSIIGDILTIILCSFLLLAYLVIFGIPVKELLALALSSAFLLNFLVSGAATDVYYNVLMLLTHPFDVGDEIVIDNTDYQVYQIGLASTSFIAPNGGKIKFINSDLWKKALINMTRAPEKIIAFDFKIAPGLDMVRFQLFKNKIQQYLRERSKDFYEVFYLESQSESNTNIDILNCRIILKCRNLKTKSRKFMLRIEMTKVINELIQALNIKIIP